MKFSPGEGASKEKSGIIFEFMNSQWPIVASVDIAQSTQSDVCPAMMLDARCLNDKGASGKATPHLQHA